MSEYYLTKIYQADRCLRFFVLMFDYNFPFWTVWLVTTQVEILEQTKSNIHLYLSIVNTCSLFLSDNWFSPPAWKSYSATNSWGSPSSSWHPIRRFSLEVHRRPDPSSGWRNPRLVRLDSSSCEEGTSGRGRCWSSASEMFHNKTNVRSMEGRNKSWQGDQAVGWDERLNFLHLYGHTRIVDFSQ